MKQSSRRFPRLRDPVTLISVIFALVWGVVALFFRPIGDYGVETDFYGDFAYYARQWMSGSPSLMNGFRGPLYYIVLGLISLPVRDAFLAGKIISVVSAAAGLWFAADIARRLFGRMAGVGAALAIAANLTFVTYAYRACSDLFYWALFAAALWFLLREESDAITSRIWAGALAGAAWLTRYNGAVLLPVGLLIPFAFPGSRLRSLRRTSIFLLAFTVVIAPWAIYVWSQTGSPFWNRNYENVAVDVLVEKPDFASFGGFMSATDLTSVGEVYRVWPAQFARTLLQNAGSHLVDDMRVLVGFPWAIPAAIGFLLGLLSGRKRRTLVFLGTGAVTYLSLLPIFYNPRFMITLLVWWGAGVGLLLERLPALLRDRPWSRSGGSASRPAAGRIDRGRASPSPPDAAGRGGPLLRLLLALCVAAAIASTFQGVRRLRDAERSGGLPIEVLDVARLAKKSGARFDDTTPIAARKPHIGYYLGTPVVSVPSGLLSDVGRTGARYFLVSGAEAVAIPALASLWAPPPGTAPPPGFSRVAQSIIRDRTTVRAATLYAVDNPAPWERRTSSPLREPLPTPSGLSRLDFLRLQLVQWYIRWDSTRDGEALIRLMAPTAIDRPDVALARADLALERDDLAGAERLYREVLVRDPGNQRAALALGGIAFLRRDSPGMHRWLSVALNAVSPDSSADPVAHRIGSATIEPSPELVRQAAMTYQVSRDFSSALAPLAAVVERGRTDPRVRLSLAYALWGIRRGAEAKSVARDFLRDFPGDPEAQKFIDSAR